MNNDTNVENKVVESDENNNVSKSNLNANNMKLIIIIGGVIILILIVVVICLLLFSGDKESTGKENGGTGNGGSGTGNGNTEEKVETNTNPGVIEDKEQDGLKFTNASLVCSDSGSKLTTVVQNTTSVDIEVRIFDIILKDADGNVIVTLQGYVGDVVPGNSSREIISNVDMNLSEATDIEYVLIK